MTDTLTKAREAIQAAVDEHHSMKVEIERQRKAIAWSIKQLEALTYDDGHGVFINGSRAELCGFGEKLDELRALAAVSNAPQKNKFLGRCQHCLDNAYSGSVCHETNHPDCLVAKASDLGTDQNG